MAWAARKAPIRYGFYSYSRRYNGGYMPKMLLIAQEHYAGEPGIYLD